jgi:hypothetical protein
MTVCDAEDCPRRATQVGVAELPTKPLELRLCDEHVAALRAGKVRGLSQATGWRHDGARPQVTFADQRHR